MNDIPEDVKNLFGERVIQEIQKPKVKGVPVINSQNKTVLKLDITQLYPNKNNVVIYLNEEDELQLLNLKESIKTEGLIHPLVAKKEGNEYVLISGHRRLKVLKELVSEGLPQFSSVLVKIMKFNNEVDEMEALLDANISVRSLSEYSKMMQVAAYQSTFLKRIELNQLSDIQVEKTYIAKKMNMSERQVSKYLYIRKHLTGDEIADLINKKLTLNKMYELMKQNAEEFESEFLSKPAVRVVKKEKTFPKLTKEEQQKLLSLQKNINKLFDQNEKLQLLLIKKKQVSSRLSKFSSSLSSINGFINDLVKPE